MEMSHAMNEVPKMQELPFCSKSDFKENNSSLQDRVPLLVPSWNVGFNWPAIRIILQSRGSGVWEVSDMITKYYKIYRSDENGFHKMIFYTYTFFSEIISQILIFIYEHI